MIGTHHIQTLSRLALLGLMGTFAGGAFGQLQVTSRSSTLRYGYVFGGGPDVHTDDVVITETDLVGSDTGSAHFMDSTSGTWAGLTYYGGVSIDLQQGYAITGPMSDVHKIVCGGRSETAAAAGGDIGSAGCNSANPGNETVFYFTPNLTTRYRISGHIQRGDVASLVYINFWDGFTWGTLFYTWSLPALSGDFDAIVTLNGGGLYRIGGIIGSRANANESDSNEFAYTFEALPRVSGHIVLNDFMGPVENEVVTAEVRQGGSVVDTISDIHLDSQGNYTLFTSASGLCDITVKGRTWLGRVATNVVATQAGATGVDFSLLNGDINGDNAVDIGDYAYLSYSYGSFVDEPYWIRNCDLNGDLAVDIGDYSILSSNYGEFGD